MHIRALPTAYTPPPALPAASAKLPSVTFQQLQRQIAALQQEGGQAAGAAAQASVTGQQRQADLARSQEQAIGSSTTENSPGSGDVPRGSFSGSTGRLIDVIA